MVRVNILNCPVDSLTIEESLDWISKCIAQKKTCRITAINANKLWLMSRDIVLARIVRNSDLIIPEWAVYWGAKQLKTPLKAHVGGISLLQSSLPWAEQWGYRVFFFGANPFVIEKMVEKIHAEYPNLIVSGWHHGYFSSKSEEDELIKSIKHSQPDILYVALGTPKQEFWIEEHLLDINVPVAMGVGGSFDVISGIKPDTPNWARGHGLEWLYRLLQDPKAYWRRYLITNTWFLFKLFKEKMIRRPKVSGIK